MCKKRFYKFNKGNNRKMKIHPFGWIFLLYNENPTIVVGFQRGLTDEQKENKRDKKYFEKGSFEKGAVSFAD